MILGSMWAPLAAQSAAAPTGGSSWLLLEVALFVVVFYFLFQRPQSKQRKQHEAAVRALKKGDEVVTAGGVVGEVIFIKMGSKDGQPEVTMDDRITIKSGESRLIIERGRVARIVTRSGETSSGATT